MASCSRINASWTFASQWGDDLISPRADTPAKRDELRACLKTVASAILADVEPGFQPGGRIAHTRNPNSEMEREDGGAFRGAQASGVWFSASRRKHRSTNFIGLESPGIVDDESSGATLELARRRRALPILI